MAIPSLRERIYEIRRQDVEKAIAERERLGRDKFNAENRFGRATKYEFVDEVGNRHPDPKAIIGVAHKYRWPRLGRILREGEDGWERDRGFASSDDLVRQPLKLLGFDVPPIATEADDDTPIPDDPHERILRAIRIRRGQSRFRDALLKAYDGQCAISGSTVRDLLEAAHIAPHANHGTYEIINGLLLRADLHTLLDCDLIAIDPKTRKVVLSPIIRTSEYRDFEGRPLRRPKDSQNTPNSAALAVRYKRLRKR